MNLAEQIRIKFANMSDGNASLLEGFKESFSSWAIKMNGTYSVGILIDEKIKVNESFANVAFYTDWFKINGENKYLLVLSSTDENLRNEFAGVCAVFLDENSREELFDPIDWWINWKNLIGNKNVEKNIHGVLGELIVLYYIKKIVSLDIQAESWTGPAGKSVDISTAKKNFEVKSTLIKYNNIVTISGQYQINPNSSCSLMLVKLEDLGVEQNGRDIVSIDMLVKKLSELGINESKINASISKLGIKEHSLDRTKQFRTLKLIEYPINEEFPIISINSFDNLKNSDRILQLTYKIDLTGLENNEIDLDFLF